MAQWWFAAAYLVNQFVVMRVYIATRAVPPWTLLLLCLSKRVHSIFLLRLFNDGITMLLANVAMLFLIQRRWRLSLLMFSAALSVKMNVLLLAPPVAIILLQVSLLVLLLLSQPCVVCQCTFAHMWWCLKHPSAWCNAELLAAAAASLHVPKVHESPHHTVICCYGNAGSRVEGNRHWNSCSSCAAAHNGSALSVASANILHH